MMQQERPPSPGTRKGHQYIVTLGAMTRDGDTLAEINEQDESGEKAEQQTCILHVPAGLPGERVTITVEAAPTIKESPAINRGATGRVRGRHRRRWKPHPRRVEISEIHQPSPLRTQAPCPVFGTCGGCQLQHMRYEAQLEWKLSTVRQLLQEIGGFADPPLLETVPCDDPWQYRNQMRFSVNRDGQPGLTARGTHRVLPLTSCPIAHAHINRALKVLSQVANARPQVLIRCGAASGQVLIQPYPTPDGDNACHPERSEGSGSTDAEILRCAQDDSAALRMTAVAQQLAASGLDLRSETMEEVLAGETFRIRPSSFFQTNTAQAEKMAQMVLHGVLNGLSGSTGNLTIADAYCGVGTFALLLARHVGRVIAIEESASAIKDAQWNLRNVSNVDILKGKTEDLLPGLAAQLDGLVLDPPRAGCQQVVLDALVQHPIRRIVYVSCDPATLARDLHVLCHRHEHPGQAQGPHVPTSPPLAPTYHLCSVQPLDMFPQTVHIECIAVLERNEL